MSWTRDDFTFIGYHLKTDVAVQVLERNEVSDQERTKFLNILFRTCSRERSVPNSMRITSCYDEQTIEERHGGYVANVFKGEDRGRPVAVKVVRSYLTDDPDKCLSVGSFQSHWRKPLLI